MIARALRALLITVLVLAAVLAAVLKWRYGGGADFPDRSGTPRLPATALEKVADLPMPPGNLAVALAGTVYATLHPEARPADKLIRLTDSGSLPFPNAAWQDEANYPDAFQNLLSIRIDRQGRLWALDNGHHGASAPRLIRFPPGADAPDLVHTFADGLAGLGSHYNDFQVSPDGRHVYIADASFFAQDPALVVLDVEARTARRLLAGHPSVVADDYTPVVQGRRMEVFGLVSIRPGVDSIVLDRRGEWLYFAPVTDLNLYRVRTRDLRDASLSAADLAGRVEVHAAKTMSDGLSIDDAGNIYISDLEHSAIVSLRPDRSLETVIADPRLRWPDGFSFGPEGWLYVSCSALHQVIGRLPGQIADAGPFQIYRVWTGQTAWPGH